MQKWLQESERQFVIFVIAEKLHLRDTDIVHLHKGHSILNSRAKKTLHMAVHHLVFNIKCLFQCVAFSMISPLLEMKTALSSVLLLLNILPDGKTERRGEMRF